MAGLRERKKRATRNAIRDAAMRLFEQDGFTHTTFDRIAEAADVSRATVFSYFPTKEEIVMGEGAAAIGAVAATLAERPAGQGTIATVRAWLGELVGLVRVFAGSATDRRPEMAAFVGDVLGLEPAPAGGVSADMFGLPDGSFFAVAGPREMGETSRTIGFLVADLEAAVSELRAAGVEVDEPAENDRHRYVHFRAPDGKLYELVQER